MHKLFKNTLLGGIAAIAISAPLSALSFAANENIELGDESLLVFQNKEFQSKEQALKYFLSIQKNNINRHNVIGSLSDSIIDSKYNMLNKNLLPDYNPSKLIFAYKASNGEIVQDPNLAKSSYARPQDSELRFTFLGNPNTPYLTKDEAQTAASKYVQDEVIPSVKIRLPKKDSPSYYLNPSNVGDIKKLKDELKNSLNSDPKLGKIWNDSVNNDSELNDMVSNMDKENNGWAITPFNCVDKDTMYKIYGNDNNKDKSLNLNKEEHVIELMKEVYPNHKINVPSGFLRSNDIIDSRSTYDMYSKKIVSSIDLNVGGDSPIYHNDYGDKDWNGWFDGIDWISDNISLKLNGESFVDYRFNEYHGDRDKKNTNAVIIKTHPTEFFSTKSVKAFTISNGGNSRLLLQWYKSPYPESNHSDFHFHFDPISSKVDASNSIFKVTQETHDAGGGYYYHHDHSEEIDNIKVTTNVQVKLDTDQFKKAKIYLASKRNQFKKILTYYGKPIFELQNINGKKLLKNISRFGVEAGSGIYSRQQNDKDTSTYISNINNAEDMRKEISENVYKQEISRVEIISKLGKNISSSWNEIYRQYIHGLNDFESNYVSPDSSFNMLGIEDMIFFDNKNVVYKNNLIYAENFNPSIWGTQFKDEIENIEDTAEIKNNRVFFSPSVSSCWVFFNSFGSSVYKIDNEGEYNNSIFDDVNLMKQNIINHEELHIDNKEVFVKTENGTILVKNETHNIYSLKYDHKTTYFKNYDDLKNYIIELISENSYKIRK